MDQSFALDWVQRNISSFGGDPKNVTIAGESSGGTSVLAQVISPWNKGKFQNAVIMSGSSMVLKYPNFGAPRPLDVAEKVATDFATAVGCKKQNAECLRNLTIGQILATQTPYMINQTIIDGDFMPISPAQAIQEGQINDVTVMVGTNRDEGRFFAGFTENETKKPLTEKSYYETLDAFFGIELATIIKQQYPISEYNSASEAYSAVMTDYLFSCPANRLMHSLSEHTKVYAYEFSDRTAPSYLKPTTFPQGAYHTAELAYLFPGFHGGKVGQPIVLNYLQEVLSNEIIQYWVTLTQSNKWKNWKPYNSKKENVYRLMLPKSHSLTKGRYISDHQCSFWDTTNVY
ncbi:carboxylesterase family protein [Vibrio olivae]